MTDNATPSNQPDASNSDRPPSANRVSGSDLTLELQELLVALTEGVLTDDQFHRLEQILADNPQARADYHRQLQMHALLMFGQLPVMGSEPLPATPEEFADYVYRASNQILWQDEVQRDAGFICPPCETVEKGRNDRRSIPGARPSPPFAELFSSLRASCPTVGWPALVLLSVLSMMVGVVGTEGWRWFQGRLESLAARSEPQVAPGELTPVAFLTAANGCDWGSQAQGFWHVGQGVQTSDELTLYEGIAEFRLASGVSLSVEGPAALVLNSPTSLLVQYGKVTVFVPWEASGFKVLASSCRIAATDAEFGVSVVGGDVDIHVFTGEAIASSSPFGDVKSNELDVGAEDIDPVQLEAELPRGSKFVKASVANGRWLELSSYDGVMRIAGWHRAKRSEFATKLSMDGPLPVTQAYVNAVLNSQPVGYWRFESRENDCIPNEVAPHNVMRIVGEVELSASGDNNVIDVGRLGSNGHLVSSEPFEALSGKAYSVEAWIKPSHSHRGGIVVLTTNPHFDAPLADLANANAFSLELIGPLVPRAMKNLGLNEPCRIRYLHRDPPGTAYAMGTSCFSDIPYTLRHWHHIVAVKDDLELRLYLDGKRTATANDPSNLAGGLYLEVGKHIGARGVLPFFGQLDELAVYGRAISAKEVEQHYQSMSWVPKQPSKKQTGAI